MQHTISQTEQGYYHCSVCSWTWKYLPGGECPGVTRYAYGQVPGHLLTYTQLKAKNLRPLDRNKPDGCYFKKRDKAWLWFYDERITLPRRKETEKQKTARLKAWKVTQEKYKCPECRNIPENLAMIKDFEPGGLCTRCKRHAEYVAKQEALEAMIKEDEKEVCSWASDMLTRDDWCLLDLETTDLNGYIIEIAIINRNGNPLFHSLVNPKCPISPDATAVHGLTDIDVAHAPTLPQIWPDLMKVLEGRKIIVTFNTAFDKGILDGDASRYNLVRSKHTWHCLMLKYAQYVGEWSNYWHDYKWQPLPGGNHRAMGDVLAALELMQGMAATYQTILVEEGK